MSELKITPAASPNFDAREGGEVSLVVLHYTGMRSGREALQRLCDKQAKVSAHYLVEEDGEIFGLVAEEKRAWHAGVSHWAGRDLVNDVSVGIEIVNPGHWWGYRPFAEPQMTAVTQLVRAVVKRWDIKMSEVVGHSDIAPTRKEDPGELFDWAGLAAQGLAIGPYTGGFNPEGEALEYETALGLLKNIGYGFDGVNHTSSLLAFQRRFLPSSLGQGFDLMTRSALIEISKAHQAIRAT
ncbi:MAG: N-acetylmuramoyl-L-alanine amidase [Parvularculaceae bacterium]